MFFRSQTISWLLCFLISGLCSPRAAAGGPRWVAGGSYFDPTVVGRPVVWTRGILRYYTDLGDLSATVSQAQANAMVSAAAALWSGIPTAALAIEAAGSLAEDVNGSNFLNGPGGLAMPSDVQSSAIGVPLAIIYDADGAVLDALQGEGASDPNSCNLNGVTTLVDNFSTNATIAHALILINGRCASDQAHIALLQYELLRGFGRILGLDWSQANDQMFPGSTTPDGLLGWPLMHPVEKLCNSNGNPCMTGTIAPRTDDIAALNRLYPVTEGNIGNFPGKLVTAAATISIQGTIHFRNGQGMQGVNVVARPLVSGTDVPDMRYPASAVSGHLFNGNAGNSITGRSDGLGRPLRVFGTDAATLEGWYDLSGIPLPPGNSRADYQISFEPVNPLYTGSESVGPYALGQVAPSGTMTTVILRELTAGSAVIQNETIADSAEDSNSGGDGVEFSPIEVPITGEWLARISGYAHQSWLRWHVRGGRQLTVEAQPLQEEGLETADKARIVAGVWNGDDAVGVSPDVSTPDPFNAVVTGLTTLSFESGNDGEIRIALADQRGDGRPDYLYRGRMLYADAITPRRVGIRGGPIVIDGVGFRPGSIVTVGGIAAQVTSIAPMEISAIAPASSGGQTGNVDVTVTDPVTRGWATIEAASGTSLSYEAAMSDQISIVTAPANAVPVGVPLAFTVKTLAANGVAPAPGISVAYTVTQGDASLGCGQTTCTVITRGDGLATMTVAASSTAQGCRDGVINQQLSRGSAVFWGNVSSDRSG
ncbi:IPT/TIG domain-containing protein [Acidisarcina polymorpha]|uniref:IPT/TIG domain-containing protein n=1 Tax=Acidisarcina polymorpha TaxID=2211140 RepID=UPI000DF01BC8|nr:IPT/TIG domain-containing protein [Acidisarcina polymorpha]